MPALFDAQFYVRANPDVAAGIADGSIPSAEAHFRAFGQFENRAPSAFFDPKLYLAANPDIAAALDAGLVESAFSHFQAFGLDEGRNPSAFFDSEFYLASNPDVAAAVEAGELPSAFAHFVQFGLTEVRGSSPFFDLPAYLAANPDVATAVQSGAISAYEHFVQFGFAEGRDLGNGISLEFFASDPVAQAAITAGDFDALFARIAEVAPFIPTFEHPSGYDVPANQPIPTNFVPNTGEFLVVPEGVTPPTTLPPGFEPPVTPPVIPPVTPPVTPPVVPPVSPPDKTPPAVTIESVRVGDDNSLDVTELNGLTARIAVTIKGELASGEHVFLDIEGFGGPLKAGYDASSGEYFINIDSRLFLNEYGKEASISAFAADESDNRTKTLDADYEVVPDVLVDRGLGSGHKFYNNFAEALAEAKAGNKVAVKNGTEIDGEHVISASISVDGNGSTFTGGVHVTGSGVSLTDFTFNGIGAAGQPTSIFVDAADVKLSGNKFLTDAAPNANGIISTGVVTSGAASGFEFLGNTVGGDYRVGVYINPLVGADQANIKDNTFLGFESRTPLVVEVNASGAVATVTENDFSGTSATRQISVEIRQVLDKPFDLKKFAGNTFNDALGDVDTIPIRVFAVGGNTVIGTDGNDRFNPRNAEQAGELEFDGGAGNDIINGAAGNDTLHGGDGDDVINGRGGDDVIDGGAGNDIIFGGAGNDTIYGGAGDDILTGEDGDDIINGGDGDDIILGEGGADTLTGGAGNDLFAFTYGESGLTTKTMDVITDFSAGDLVGVKNTVLEFENFKFESYKGEGFRAGNADSFEELVYNVESNLLTDNFAFGSFNGDGYLFFKFAFDGDFDQLEAVKLQGVTTFDFAQAGFVVA